MASGINTAAVKVARAMTHGAEAEIAKSLTLHGQLENASKAPATSTPRSRSPIGTAGCASTVIIITVMRGITPFIEEATARLCAY